MLIDCISDLHGFYPILEGGDLLIVAGDHTARDKDSEWLEYAQWLGELPYRRIVLIAGNHDNKLRELGYCYDLEGKKVHYLEDNGCRCLGFKIWGSPWTVAFEGQNPLAAAFCLDTDDELAEKWALIPSDTDILVTHSPPAGILDTEHRKRRRCGSVSLYQLLYQEKIHPRLHVFGHIHESYGHRPKVMDLPYTQFVNASYVDKDYNPVNKPIRIEL